MNASGRDRTARGSSSARALDPEDAPEPGLSSMLDIGPNHVPQRSNVAARAHPYAWFRCILTQIGAALQAPHARIRWPSAASPHQSAGLVHLPSPPARLSARAAPCRKRAHRMPQADGVTRRGIHADRPVWVHSPGPQTRQPPRRAGRRPGARLQGRSRMVRRNIPVQGPRSPIICGYRG
jgi:hypothetical protein